jgi:hypothetical protein
MCWYRSRVLLPIIAHILVETYFVNECDLRCVVHTQLRIYKEQGMGWDGLLSGFSHIGRRYAGKRGQTSRATACLLLGKRQYTENRHKRRKNENRQIKKTWLLRVVLAQQYACLIYVYIDIVFVSTCILCPTQCHRCCAHNVLGPDLANGLWEHMSSNLINYNWGSLGIMWAPCQSLFCKQYHIATRLNKSRWLQCIHMDTARL